MLSRIPDSYGLGLNGPILTNNFGLPRFWPAVWMSFLPGDLASSTVTKKLRQLETFYAHVDETAGSGVLDDALATADVEILSTSLESYFLMLKNGLINSTTEERWQIALEFVLETVRRIARSAPIQQDQQSLTSRLKQLELLNGHLTVGKRKRPEQVRSLPSEVVEALFEMLDPESHSNPFRDAKSRWRVYVTFALLLHQGLRIGEVLSCPVDVIKSAFDRTRREQKYWMSVKYNEYEDDPRYSKPRIKNIPSIRVIPVSGPIASLVTEYLVSYRGKAQHTFLLNSQHRKPLSLEGASKMFRKISASLPSAARKSLRESNGAESISSHDLRHTCAVVRLNQFLSSGLDMTDALERMRPFFGWSRNSEMPLRYARSVFEDRLASVWAAAFDERTEMIRSLPRRVI